MKELFKNENYCKQELLKAREIFGNIHTTKEQYENTQKCLALMYVYCPENIIDLVYANLLESEIRFTYLLIKG